MEELLSPLLGLMFGFIAMRPNLPRGLLAIRTVAIVALAGTVATLVTGEDLKSWQYYLIDCATGAVGVATSVMLFWLQRRLRTWRFRKAEPDLGIRERQGKVSAKRPPLLTGRRDRLPVDLDDRSRLLHNAI